MSKQKTWEQVRTYRDAETFALDHGLKYKGTVGSHGKYENEYGAMTIKQNHMNEQIPQATKSDMKRQLKAMHVIFVIVIGLPVALLVAHAAGVL